MVYEYYWYFCWEFRLSLEIIYKFLDFVCFKNCIWFCKLLVVFVLGEFFNSYEFFLIDLNYVFEDNVDLVYL